MTDFEELIEAREFLLQRIGGVPDVAMVLGSGLSDTLWEDVKVERLAYSEVPHFPQSSVVGHAGELAWGEWQGTRIVALAGRVHVYENIPIRKIVFAVRCLGLLGVEKFVITNAAGAISPAFAPGDLMLITDHINLLGENPLSGDNIDELGDRFPDMTRAYDPDLFQTARECGTQIGLRLREGVYASVRGPSYETPAEIGMLRAIGADAVGMSTVPEVIALNHMKKKVLGISCLTNMAAGMLPSPLVHEEVLEITRQVRRNFSRLILCVTSKIGNPES